MLMMKLSLMVKMKLCVIIYNVYGVANFREIRHILVSADVDHLYLNYLIHSHSLAFLELSDSLFSFSATFCALAENLILFLNEMIRQDYY